MPTPEKLAEAREDIARVKELWMAQHDNLEP
jgi:hypothetical protein